LEQQQPYHAAPCLHRKAIRAGFHDSARLTARLVLFSLHFRSKKNSALALKIRVGVRPWMETTNLVVNFSRRPRPVDDAVGLFDLVGVTRLGFVLRRLRGASLGESVNGVDKQVSAKPGEIVLDVRARLVVADCTRDFAIIGPASSALTTRMMVTPVIVSPAITAR